MDKWRHSSSFLAGLLLVVGALAWIVVPSAAFAQGPPAQNQGQPFAETRGVTQNWDKTLGSMNGDEMTGCNSDRFTCIFPDDTFPDGAAVRDNETGLVWERSPDIIPRPWISVFSQPLQARRHCSTRTTGGRKAWRLPSVHELASLVDPSKTKPALPTDHPFTTIANVDYWSATTSLDDSTGGSGWIVSFLNGDLSSGRTKDKLLLVLCVRGGHNDGSQY